MANATTLNMATVGLINALVDAETMMMGMLHWAVNNTYNLPAYSEEIYETAVANVTDPDRGCFALLGQCRAAVAESDPDSEGTNQEVNEICGLAVQACMFTTAVYQEYSPVSDCCVMGILFASLAAECLTKRHPVLLVRHRIE